MSPEARSRRSEFSQCRGKRRYRDRDEAKRVRQVQTARTGDPIRLYDCPFCKGVHFTKQEER